MKLSRALVVLVFCLVPIACRSSAPRGDAPCTCGQPAADVEGCAHSACMSGHRNPDNPDCVCGTLSIPK